VNPRRQLPALRHRGSIALTHGCWSVLLASLVCVQVAAGQHLGPGQRVRITTDSTLTGWVDSLNRDRIWLRQKRVERIPLNRIQRIELSRGRKADLGQGAAYGARSPARWLAAPSGPDSSPVTSIRRIPRDSSHSP
jgi:hypothetical protein